MQYVTIGKITRPWGLRGEVSVFPLTDQVERFSGLSSVLVEDRAGRLKLFTIEGVRRLTRSVAIQFAGVSSEEAAEALRGCFLVVPREEVASLPAGSFYVFDMIGMQVETDSGKVLGRLADVEHYPANDVFVVDCGGKTSLVPAVREIVREIRLDEKRMIVEERPGLFE